MDKEIGLGLIIISMLSYIFNVIPGYMAVIITLLGIFIIDRSRLHKRGLNQPNNNK